MSTYRLLDAHGDILAAYDAADDADACLSGCGYSRDDPRTEPRFGVRSDFRAQRRDGGLWRPILAWVPG